jgi:ABC-2 type transport system ATP-binding protein
MPAVIELTDVVKTFRAGGRTVTAVDRLSVSVASGKLTGLVGPDGAGKTTLMRLVAGLLRPDSGRIQVLGLDSVADAQSVQSSIGYMPQRFGLYEDLSVLENLKLYADLHGLEADERRARFERLMAFTGLAPFKNRLAGRLSGGMKQKLGLACTLVHPPQLLLLDEPSVGVDPVSRRELWTMVEALLEEGISVLWSTAYLDEAARCHAVMLLHEGRLLSEGPPDQLTARVRDRTFAIAAPGAEKRTVLSRALASDLVADALIKGREVRVLTADHATVADVAQAIGDAIDKRRIKPVEPTFEDAFIDLLRSPGESAGIDGQPKGAAGLAARSAPDVSDAPAAQQQDRPANSEPVIHAAGLVRDFGAFRAVDHVDFDVRRGEIFGLLGPNGAGKSTTFKILCGLLPPTDGVATVLGIDLRSASARARGRIGYMAQKFSLYGNMSALQNLRFFASAYGLAGRARDRRIDAELDEFDLRRYADMDSAELPLGYKQRLALACAIMHAPGVLFLDEPTSGVDPLVRREFWLRINDMASAGVTVMVTTHFMEEAEYCDRIGIIYQGRIVASGAPDELREASSTSELPDPTLEDAFVSLIGRFEHEHRQ